ncbi:MAG: hypothetical protein ACLP7J_25100 [Streptosporangiaceae bacterium]
MRIASATASTRSTVRTMSAAADDVLAGREAGDRGLVIAADALREQAAEYPADGYDHSPLAS